MEKDYDYILVLGSFLTAFLTSFLAIAYASFIIWHKRYNSFVWTFTAAVNMGMGVWTMHFIGMLALHIDTPVSFAIDKTVLSAIIAVVGSYFAFKILLDSKHHHSLQRKLWAAFILGTSVSLMHYIGMDAMNMFPPIRYTLSLVILSIVIAYTASFVGLVVFIRSASQEKNNVFIVNNLLASIILGTAIAAMHYTGMAAANFDKGSYCTVQQGIEVGRLATYIVGAVMLMLTTSIMFIIYAQNKSRAELEDTNHQLESLVKIRTQEIEEAMETLKSTQSQLVENEKMASLGNLVAGVAHEVNTPLGVGLTSSTLLREKVQHLNSLFKTNKLTQTALSDFLTTSTDACEILEDNLHKAADLITSFKQLAVDQTSDQAFTFNVYDTLHSSLASLHHVLKKGGIESELICDELLTCRNSAGALSQIITNMIMNASIHAFDENSVNPKITIDASKTDTQGVIIHFTDNGKGMSKEILDQAFDPFFTTRRGLGGSGLGLHLVYNLVNQKLKGQIDIDSTPGVGTTFTIRFSHIKV